MKSILMQRGIGKIAAYYRENGAGQLIRACLKALKKTLFFYQKEVIGGLSVVDAVFTSSPKIPVTVGAAEPSDVPELKTLTAGYKKRDFSQWIKDGFILAVARLPGPSAGPIVGYICACPAPRSTHKLVSMLKLSETDYWALDAFIHPDYRGKGINVAIASGFLAQARSKGYTRGFGTILFTNTASRKSYALIGEKEIGIFTTLTIMGITFRFLKRNKGFEEYSKRLGIDGLIHISCFSKT
jgi:GNAT superfamily N-acetyltransferase